MKLRYAFFLLMLPCLGCKKPYAPPASSAPGSYLVVEGIINSGNDSTIISINKTVKLTDKATSNPVLGATVTVEGEQGGIYHLNDYANNGRYASAGSLNLSTSQRYRLRINNGTSQYLSDFVAVKATPPIDSVGYNIQNDNVNIYVNAHDATNNTRYYRWDYDETWQFHSKFQSSLLADTLHDIIVARTAETQIYNCFGNDHSSHIVVNSTAALAKDVVYQNSIVLIPLSSEKVETRYSILLRQYALTQEAFQFYQLLQKNTEDIGSIFDAQPSQVTGNIHCVSNPAELVLGYITACNVQSKRIFISQTDLPYVPTIYPYDCEIDIALDPEDTFLRPPIEDIPIGPASLGITYSSIQCVDCTIRGTTKAPAWWH